MRELHWALVPVFIPVGSAVIRWTLGLSLVALAYYTWAGNPGLSQLPGIAIFAYTAFLLLTQMCLPFGQSNMGHLYEALEIRTPLEGTQLEPLSSYTGKTTPSTRFRWGTFFSLLWALGLGIGYYGLLAGHFTALGFPLALSGYLLVRRVIHWGPIPGSGNSGDALGECPSRR
ncbi:hypothetical protein KQ693_03075 [Thermus sp. PS18]|uniref:hypothetical protein n=1 Tax=Thermus sp. PS18 TaxID=2849039 RepID=UPI00226414A8|nr:hypothetical protein [Thermus sp. PS18]UZX16036.1 hypothetical protein KQ693_03075 [Thermus sp. PS18]